MKKISIIALLFLISSFSHASIKITDKTSGAEYDSLVNKVGASYIGGVGASKSSAVPTVPASRLESSNSHFSAATTSSVSTSKARAAATSGDARARFQNRFQQMNKSAATEDDVVASSDTSNINDERPSFAELAEQYQSR